MRRGIDYIGIGVGAIIFNDRGQVFLARRGPQARNERLFWEFPGGGVEFGETLEQALVREIHEEFAFSVKVHRLLNVVNHIIPDEQQHWVSPTFLCTHTSGIPIIQEPEKCLEIRWFDLDAIPPDLTSASQQSLQALRASREPVS